MVSDAVKIARIQAKEREKVAMAALVREAISNPVIELIAGVWLVEHLANNPLGNPTLPIGELKQTTLEAALTGAVIAQQLGAENTTKLLQSGGSSLMKLLPALVGA